MSKLYNFQVQVFIKVRVNANEIAAETTDRAIKLLKDRIENDTDIFNVDDPGIGLTSSFVEVLADGAIASIGENLGQGLIEQSDDMKEQLEQDLELYTNILPTLNPQTQAVLIQLINQEINDIQVILNRIERLNA